MHVRGLWALAAATVLLAGCASSDVETTVRANGSFERRVEMRGPWLKTEPGQGTITMKPDARLDRLFVAPSGPGVTSRFRGRQGDEEVWVFTRQVPAGAALVGDVTVLMDVKKGAKGPRVTNTARVRQISAGRWEYAETLRLAAPADPRAMLKRTLAEGDMREMKTWLKAALPARLATPRSVEAFADQFTLDLMDVMFGPPDPLFDQVLLNVGAARFRMSVRLTPVAVKTLDRVFGSRMTFQERARAAQSLVTSLQRSAMAASGKAQRSGPSPSQETEGVPVFMAFTVGLPGRVVETNGIHDPVTNRVRWGLYSLAPAVHDVTLRAVYEVR